MSEKIKMKCLYCEGPSRVIDSAFIPEDNIIVRERRCYVCIKTFVTRETLVTNKDVAALLKKEKNFHRKFKDFIYREEREASRKNPR